MPTRMTTALIAARVVLAGVALLALGALGGTAEPRSATVPLALDHNRMTVAVEFPRPGGGVRTARAWVDMGGTDIVVSESLARDLGIDVPSPLAADRSVPSPSRAPAMRVGGVALHTEGIAVAVRAGGVALPGIKAECTIAPRCLRRLHVVFDFPGQMTWWQAGPAPARRDLDIVGLTLRPESDGSFAVAGVVSRNGRAMVGGVEPNDRLLRVDGLDVANVPMGGVIEALRGTPGATRTLLLERAGRRITVQATVVRLP